MSEEFKQLPDGWVIKKFSEIANIIGGGTPKTSVDSYWGGLIPWLSVKDFNNSSRYVYVTEKMITELGLKNSSTKLLDAGDIIISARGTVGEVAQLKKTMAFNQSCYGIKAKQISNNDYIYYLLKYKVLEIQSKSHGSVFDTITRSTFDNLEVAIPPLEEQREIAAVLSALDDKIEVNQQINKKLEEMAQAIFKQWFIDFNFPDENGNPYKDSGGTMIDSELGQIPAGWTIGAIQNEFNITMGQSPAGSSYNETKNGTLFFQGRTDFNNRFPSNRLFTTEPKRFAKKFDVLLSVRAPVGDINVAIHDCCIGRGLAAVSSQHQSYCYYKINSLKEEFELYNGTGTIFGAINKTQLENIKVIIPPLNTINKVEETINKFDLQIYQKYKEILNLQKIRNILLNRLMSGKIRIQDENQI